MKVGGSLLVVEAVYWVILMGISFSGTCQLLRKVCVDNRCPERLYIQNGYWRPNVEECNEMENSTGDEDYSKLDQQLSGSAYFMQNFEEDLSGSALEDTNTEDLETMSDGDGGLGASGDRTSDTTNATAVTVTPVTSDNSTTEQNTTDSREDDEDDVLWSPIGKMKSTPHFTASVVYAVIILLLWYLYPIMLFFSFAKELNEEEI